MKILLIGYSFPPENTPRAFRAFELAKAFSKLGHEVHLAFPFVDPIAVDEMAQEWGWKFTILASGFWKNKGAKQNSALANGGYTKGSGLRSLAKMLFHWAYPAGSVFEFALVCAQFLLKSNEKYDRVVSIGLPVVTHWGVALAKCLRPKLMNRWVADYGDPFAYSQEFETYCNERWIEKMALRYADAVMVPVESARVSFQKLVKPNQLHIVPQGVDLSYQCFPAESAAGCIKFAYAGLFYRGNRDPSCLFDFLQSSAVEFEFHLFVNPQNEFVIELLQRYGQTLGKKLVVHEMMPRRGCIQALSEFDFLVNIENASSNQVPSKIIDYALAGRPIISLRSETFQVKALEEFLNRNYQGRLEVDLAKFDSIRIAQKVLEL